MKKRILLFAAFVFSLLTTFSQLPATPDQLYGELFRRVQMEQVFPDGKTFVDCIPKRDPKAIMKDYHAQKGKKAFDLKKFVEENFNLPRTPQLNYITKEKDVLMHIKNLWGVLRREPDSISPPAGGGGWVGAGSSLLPLPYPYIVPGGRFREIYYWDSYFTMLGLKESGETGMIENMVNNFAYMINTYGHIPNGNRSYYLSRSQPPFFSLMVELLATVKGDSVYKHYLPELEKEYLYWMEGAGQLRTGRTFKRVVKLNDSTILNRYWDENPAPRQESYREDVLTTQQSGRNRYEMYRNLRAGACSGWDFSSRWFRDKKNLTTIQVVDMIPVDLNCLLYKLEMVIVKGKLVTGQDSLANVYRQKAGKRRRAIDKFCWNQELKYYTDYNYKSRQPSDVITPAGIFPFCFFQQNPDYMSLLARQAAEQVKTKLLQPGGIRATINNTGQQWDAPNGWAPLIWMTITGMDRCGQRELAREIAKRWIKLNIDVFNRTGKLMEKYNVSDLKLEAGGGEYPSQDGFGWTNGVLLALIKKYGRPED